MAGDKTRHEPARAGWPIYDQAPPFFELTRRDGRVQAKGTAHCHLGSRVQDPDGGTEDGVYAGWNWDGKSLTARVDPLGFYSLFVYSRGDTLAVSPSLLQLIAVGADTALDHRALGVFYRLGLFINDDTPFRHIRVLPPGGVLHWENGTVTTTGRGDLVPEQQDITRSQAIDGLIELTRSSLRTILNTCDGPFILPLSGGRDSRHILLELDHLGARPEACVTFQHSSRQLDADASAARAVCERVGIRHLVLGSPRTRSHDILRALVLSSLCSDEHLQMMPLHDFLTTGPWAALDGIAGDILTNPDDAAEGHFRNAQKGDFAAIARGMMDGHSGVISRPGCDDAPGRLFSEQTRDETVAYVADTIAGFSEAADPYQAFWFWHRTRREIGFVPSSVFGSASAVFCPFLDHRFVRFGLSLPYSITRDQDLHDEALRRAYPDYADIAFADSMASQPRQRGSLRAKLNKAVAGIGTILALRPDHPLAEMKSFLRGYPGLHRRPGEILQLHNLALSGLDAQLARDILGLATAYRRTRPRAPVTDSFFPGGQP